MPHFIDWLPLKLRIAPQSSIQSSLKQREAVFNCKQSSNLKEKGCSKHESAKGNGTEQRVYFDLFSAAAQSGLLGFRLSIKAHYSQHCAIASSIWLSLRLFILNDNTSRSSAQRASEYGCSRVVRKTTSKCKWKPFFQSVCNFQLFKCESHSYEHMERNMTVQFFFAVKCSPLSENKYACALSVR